MAVKHFLAIGKDGYFAFQDPSIEWLSDIDAALTIQDVVVLALERCAPTYQIVLKSEALR